MVREDGWVVIENEDDWPEAGRFILYLGKKGAYGCGFAGEKTLFRNEPSQMIECGHGAAGMYRTVSIYAYKYFDYPKDLLEIVVDKDAKNKTMFQLYNLV